MCSCGCRRPGGQWRWFRRRGAMERDALGRITSFTGQLIDIHDERQAQAELREIRARFERAIEGSTDGLFEYDLHQRRDLVLAQRARDARLRRRMRPFRIPSWS